MSAIYIGIAGWRYEPWRGVFYPDGWPQDRELEFAAHNLPSIELNGSFYALQKQTSYAACATSSVPSCGGAQPADAHLISTKPAPKRASRDIYCYFDNDIKVHAPFDARKLIVRLGLDQL